MPAPALTFRIFLSSPGDVPQERNDAQTVVDEINASREFKDMFTSIELYRWDDPNVVLPMPVTDIPQKSVDIYMTRPSSCDLVIVIFWSRMGSPLKMDEREYLSGTHYEYSEALGGYEQHGKPIVWLYRCQEKLQIDLDDVDFDKKKAQYDRVKAFFSQFMDEEGRFTGGVNGYPTHPGFKALFKNQLITYLRHLREKGEQPPPPPKPLIDVPYKGLVPLKEADVPIFFGRTAETLHVLGLVKSKRLVPILGASGSGKSSLVMAGVLPLLKKQGWRIIQLFPSENPFYQLAKALIATIPEMGIAPNLDALDAFALRLAENPRNLITQIELALPNQQVVIYIDQFEELFTLTEKANPTLVKPFIEAIRHPASTISTILTMRADFYETALAYVPEVRDEAYGLIKPSVLALSEMITRPAQEAGYVLDAGLVGRMIDDLGDVSGTLALMAYLMQTLYLRALERGDKHITNADYKELGGVIGAINTLAQTAYDQLMGDEDAKKRVLQHVFSRLVAVKEDGTPTRKRWTLIPENLPSDQRTLIDIFIKGRLLVYDDVDRQHVTLEVAHEALFSHWTTLAEWITARKGDLYTRDQILRDAKQWEAHKKPEKSFRYDGERLKLVHEALARLELTLDDLTPLERDFLEPEQDRLVRELENPNTNTARRMQIGFRLNDIGDTRPGVGFIQSYKIPLPDIVWCLIPKGEFIMGSDKHGDDEKPEHRLYLDDFYMSRYLVTYAQYATFENAPDFRDWAWWVRFPDEHKRQKFDQRFQYRNHPRENVTWYGAMAFGRWLTHHTQEAKLPMRVWDMTTKTYQIVSYPRMEITLPSEAEYEKSARAIDGRIYPYGNTFDRNKGNTNETGLKQTSAVGIFPDGESPYGVLDASGNVWKWTRSLKKVYKYNRNDGREDEQGTGVRILRGGSWGSTSENARASYRDGFNQYFRNDILGFFVVCRPY